MNSNLPLPTAPLIALLLILLAIFAFFGFLLVEYRYFEKKMQDTLRGVHQQILLYLDTAHSWDNFLYQNYWIYSPPFYFLSKKICKILFITFFLLSCALSGTTSSFFCSYRYCYYPLFNKRDANKNKCISSPPFILSFYLLSFCRDTCFWKQSVFWNVRH